MLNRDKNFIKSVTSSCYAKRKIQRHIRLQRIQSLSRVKTLSGANEVVTDATHQYMDDSSGRTIYADSGSFQGLGGSSPSFLGEVTSIYNDRIVTALPASEISSQLVLCVVLLHCSFH